MYERVLLLGLSMGMGFLASACGSSGSDGETKVELTTGFFEGSYELSGVVTFASAIPKGTALQLILTEASSYVSGGLDSGNEIRNGWMGASSSSVAWAIHDIGPGDYWVSLAADLSGDGVIGDGDSGGYYAGTVESPFQFTEQASTITVTNGSLVGLDFGAAAIRCLSQWGEVCSSDSECRGASCVYSSSLRVTAAAGSCVDGTCQVPDAACSEVNGEAGTVEPSDCFGDP